MRTTTVVWDDTNINEITTKMMMDETAINIANLGFDELMTRSTGPGDVVGSIWHTITRSWSTLEAAEQWITFVNNQTHTPVSAVINPE